MQEIEIVNQELIEAYKRDTAIYEELVRSGRLFRSP